MKALVIGSGMMGSAMASDLARSPGVTEVIVADIDITRAEKAAAAAGPNAKAAQIDIDGDDGTGIAALMRRADVALGATTYRHNVALTKAAIAARVHFCDLGGNMDVVDRQCALDADAKKAGILVLPNCGLAPGMACVIAAGAAAKLDTVVAVHIRVGGLPQHPVPPLNYQLVFSAEGLINEYLEPAEVLREGELRLVPSMEELEELEFSPPIGRLEAFNTSGGVSTLTRMFRGKALTFDYKTIRYPGHCARFKKLLDLGFAGNEPIVIGDSVRTARELFEELLRRKLPSNGPDIVLMRVTATGTAAGKRASFAYEMADYYDESAKTTSMMRTTAFPTSIIAQMTARGDVTVRGVKPPEQCIPLEPFLAELAKRKIVVRASFEEGGRD